VLIWRKGSASPNVQALCKLLVEAAPPSAAPPRRPRSGELRKRRDPDPRPAAARQP
jgi:hypothetical protein